MPTDTPKPSAPTGPRQKPFWANSPFRGMPTNWELANGAIKVVGTSFALAPVTTLQTEFQTAAQMKGRLPLGMLMFRAFGTNVGLHTSRSTVTITGKSHNKVEEAPRDQFGYARLMNTLPWLAADDLSSTPFGVKGKLTAAGILPKGFKSPTWAASFHNIGQSLMVGAPLRLTVGFSNLTFLFYGSDKFTHMFTFNNQLVNNLVGGATAGVAAAGATGALKGLYDDQLQQSVLKPNGRIQTMNTFKFFKHHAQQAASMPVRELFLKTMSRAFSDIAHTGMRNALIFSVIQGAMHILGDRPLGHFVEKPTVTSDDDVPTPPQAGL